MIDAHRNDGNRRTERTAGLSGGAGALAGSARRQLRRTTPIAGASTFREGGHAAALLIAKAALFVALGAGAAAILIAEEPKLSIVLLLGVSVWAFARAYYFAFYVIEHYVDRSYRFSGIWFAVVFLVRRRSSEWPRLVS